MALLQLHFKAPTRRRALLEGVALFWLIASVAITMSVFLPLVVAILVSGLLGGPLVVARMLRAGPVAAIGPLLGMIAASLGCFFVGPPIQTLRGERVHDIPVQEIARHPRATIFGFTDASLRLELQSKYEYDAGDVTRTVYAVPVVGRDWSPKEPVHVWACSRSENGDGEWSKPAKGGYRMKEEDDDSCRKAVASAVGRAALTTPTDVPIIVWSSDPEGESREDLLLGLLLILVPFLALLVGLPLWYPHLARFTTFPSPRT